jgi:hypothetical protein
MPIDEIARAETRQILAPLCLLAERQMAINITNGYNSNPNVMKKTITTALTKAGVQNGKLCIISVSTYMHKNIASIKPHTP